MKIDTCLTIINDCYKLETTIILSFSSYQSLFLEASVFLKLVFRDVEFVT